MPPSGSPISSRSTRVPPDRVVRPDAGSFDLSTRKRVHIVGVAGAGMSAIALLLARMGHEVSGSDIKSAPVLERLAAAGVDVRVGNRAEHVPDGADAVVYSTAIPRSNVELVTAEARGVPVLHRSAALAALSLTRKTVAVAGSHGKTTTASMLALILREAEWSPSFVIGGEVNEVGTNAAFGDGEWMVVEADESDGTFLHLVARAALVTNVEPDHLDHYGDFAALVGSFEQFVDAVDGQVVVCADDAVTARLAADRPGVRTYGYAENADYCIVDEVIDAAGCHFALVAHRADRIDVALPAGVKAATNAAGAIAIALELGVDAAAAVRALARFGGVARRFQYRGERAGVTFIDDYAHLPTEVEAAIEAARRGPWRHVVVVFQPHRYSRTASIGPQFADAFSAADQLVLTDVYPAGETAIPGVSGRTILGAVLDRHPALPVAYLPKFADLGTVPERYARPGDLVLTLGAGDLTTMPDVWIGGAS
jgi:UDP-N-acetylmuramate--alanine ligase